MAQKENIFLRNNFDLIRFILAFIVMLVHSAALSNNSELNFINKILGDLSVKCFFVISGFLVMMSYEKANTIQEYFSRRIRRIYPGYFTVIIITSLLGFVFSTNSFQSYFSYNWIKYILANLSFMNFLHPDLPGVFSRNSNTSVNGALWSLKIEVMFYILIPFISLISKKYGHFKIVVLLYVFAYIYKDYILNLFHLYNPEFARQLPGQLSYFSLGIAGFYFYKKIGKIKTNIIWILIVLATLYNIFGLEYIEPIILAFFIFYLAFCIPYLGRFSKYGDLSYGLYIIHFPVIQALVSLNLFTETPFYSVLLAGFISISGSYALWHLVEKRFLNPKSHYI